MSSGNGGDPMVVSLEGWFCVEQMRLSYLAKILTNLFDPSNVGRMDIL